MKVFRWICLVALFCAFTVSVSSQAQETEYVCTPCGSDCDKEIYSKPGKCKHCGMDLVDKKAASVRNITAAELCARVGANPNVVLLDVRSPGEFTGSDSRESYGHFKNAININITELGDRLNELAPYKNDEIIVYCSHSHRSPLATYLLSSSGFKNVSNMSGGVSTLENASVDPCLSKIFVKH